MQQSPELQEMEETFVDCKIIARPADLLKSLQLVLPIVPRTSNINTIITDFLMEIDNNYLKVTGTDYKNTIISEQELTHLEGKTKLRIQAHLLCDILKSLDSSEEITLVFKDKKLTISASCGTYNLITQEESEYPKIKKSASIFSSVIESELLARIIRIRYACSADDSRPAQQGIYFNFTNEYSDFVACNGFTVHQIKRFDIKPENHSALIPGKSLSSLEPLIKGEDFVKLSLMQNHFAFSATSTQFITTKIDEKYVMYQQVMDTTNHYFSIIINRQLLLSCLERISLLQPNNDLVKLEIEEKEIFLLADSHLGDVQETLFHNSENVLVTALFFNIKRMIPVIKHLDSVDIELKYKEDANVFFLPHPQREHEEEKILLVPINVPA